MANILNISPLTSPWTTQDPFLFCAYHLDNYPGGNENLGPNASLEGRKIGQDFENKDGWNMYHGTTVPGFPAHPHRGFETVTIAAQGLVDHSDSLGALGRFGNGDVQWLTSGKGIQHAEMFPLLDKDKNTLDLFQIWLNLPQKSKMVEPHYKMLWAEDIPVITEKDQHGNSTTINLIAGNYKNRKALSPTPDSWAASPDNDVQIWTFTMEPHAVFTIPAAKSGANRSLYFHDGTAITIDQTDIANNNKIDLNPSDDITIKNGESTARFLLLQGRPIDEPVAQYGPFVMNTDIEIREAMQDFQQTQFGGWPYGTSDPNNGKSKGRFAKFADGSEEVR